MTFTEKLQLYRRAFCSAQAQQVRKEYFGRLFRREDAAKLRRMLSEAIYDYFFDLGMVEIGLEMKDWPVVCEKRHEPGHFGLGTIHEITELGDTIDGEWERIDDAPRKEGAPG